MFGSYQVELAIGLAAIIIAVVLWRYLLRAFRRVPVPFLLRSDMAAEVSAVVEIALLSIGFAYLVKGLAEMIP